MDNNIEHKPEPSSDLYAFDKKTSFRRNDKVVKRTPKQGLGLMPKKTDREEFLTSIFTYVIMGVLFVFLLICAAKMSKRVKYFTPFGPIYDNPNYQKD